MGDLHQLMPTRDPQGHKGTHGRLVLVVGSDQYTGAAILAVEAALRCGVGMVCCITTPKAAAAIRFSSPEDIVFESAGPQLTDNDLAPLQDMTESVGVSAIGMGSGMHELATPVALRLAELSTQYHIPLVIDAGAIGPMVTVALEQSQKKYDWVLTPHVGELNALTNQLGIPSVSATNDEQIQTLSNQLGMVLCVKSATTWVCDAQTTWERPIASAALASAGSGDVLLGMIASWLAHGATPTEATQLGVTVHGMASIVCEQAMGVRSVLARDLISMIPRCIKEASHGDQ